MWFGLQRPTWWQVIDADWYTDHPVYYMKRVIVRNAYKDKTQNETTKSLLRRERERLVVFVDALFCWWDFIVNNGCFSEFPQKHFKTVNKITVSWDGQPSEVLLIHNFKVQD